MTGEIPDVVLEDVANLLNTTLIYEAGVWFLRQAVGPN